MKTILLSAFLLLLVVSANFAQNLIAVQNGGTPKFYSVLDSAIIKSQNGDTIYLSAGSYLISGVLEKCLHIVGNGCNPDSTFATGVTILSNLSLGSGSSNGSIIGTYISSTISIASNITGYTFSRCYLTGGLKADFNIDNFVIKECKIGSYSNCSWCSGYNSINGSVSNIYLANNIIFNSIGSQGGVVKNNVFLQDCCSGYCTITSVNNCLVENNIVRCTNGFGSNSIFRNNINFGVNGVGSYGNQGSNNLYSGLPIDSIFVNTTSLDLHLRSGSPYHNAGTDGTDIGIYGGAFPWKEGSVPSNPHFQTVKIAPKTDANGSLNVNIKVKAQDN